MEGMDIRIVGPDETGRATLTERMQRLGHQVVTRTSVGPGKPREVTTVVDARGHDHLSSIDGEISAGLGPVVLVSDRPQEHAPELGRRAAVIIAAGESDAGYQVALQLCAGLRGVLR